MADVDVKEQDVGEYIARLEGMTKQLSGKLDHIHDQEFRKNIVQPVLLVLMIGVVILFYFYLPIGLFAVIVSCFLLSWNFPALQIPLWLAVILLVFVGFHVVTGSFAWTWTPT